MIDGLQLFESTSGAAGDVIASHNAGGPYIRARTAVTNPNTTKQQAQRTTFADVSAAWRDTLTNDQRDAWWRYAAQRTPPNPFGPRGTSTGQQEFCRSNVARRHAALGYILTPPTITADPVPLHPVIEQRYTSTVMWIVPQDDPWLHTDGAYCLIYVSPAIPTSINWYERPHQYYFKFQGSSSAPPLAPFFAALPLTLTDDEHVSFKTTIVYPDGRVSPSKYQTTNWLMPPVPIKVQQGSGPQIQVEFDRPLQFDSLPALSQFSPRKAVRGPTSTWRFGSPDFFAFIDPDDPYWLLLTDTNPAVSTNPPGIGYLATTAPYLVRQGSQVRVQNFSHPVPWN